MRSHARVNSKSVRGGAVTGARNSAADVAVGTGAVTAGCGCGVGGASVGGCSPGAAVSFLACGGSTVSAGAGTWRVLNTVSFPDTRKMPPPTRPADCFSSRTCFASLNDVGLGFSPAATPDGVDLESGGAASSTRELMTFKRSFLFVGSVLVEGEGVSSSTMVIGTRRRFGCSAELEVGGGVGISMGADRCATQPVTQSKEKCGKGEKETHCLSFALHNEPVHTGELGLDSFVIRFDPECPLEVCKQ
jgi:hypothetical protein